MLLRHIGIVCKEDINNLEKFYSKLFHPVNVHKCIEEGEKLKLITGVDNIKLITCKIQTKNFMIELIQYLDPKPLNIPKKSPAFTGLNHFALTVKESAEFLDLVEKYGGKLIGNGAKDLNENVRSAIYVCDPEGNIIEVVEESM